MILTDYLNPEQKYDLLQTIQEPRDIALIKLILNSGINLSEIPLLKISHIKWSTNSLHIPGKRSRKIELTIDASNTLKQWLKVRPKTKVTALFISLKGKTRVLTSRGIDHIIRNWGSKSGIPNLSARTLKNTYTMFTKSELKQKYKIPKSDTTENPTPEQHTPAETSFIKETKKTTPPPPQSNTSPSLSPVLIGIIGVSFLQLLIKTIWKLSTPSESS